MYAITLVGVTWRPYSPNTQGNSYRIWQHPSPYLSNENVLKHDQTASYELHDHLIPIHETLTTLYQLNHVRQVG